MIIQTFGKKVKIILNVHELILTIFLATLGSSGLWTLVLYFVQRKDKKRDKEDEELCNQLQMLLGLGHDIIVYFGKKYIEKGYVTDTEFENLNKYLYEPYLKLGGNGTAEKIMNDVKKLPVKND